MPLEIERKYLLSALPAIPPAAEIWKIEQGYLSRTFIEADFEQGRRGLAFGRIRRTTLADGTIVCTHSIKSGIGLVRQELETTLTPKEFEDHWPRTRGRRLEKTRYRVPESSITWEIDDIHSAKLVFAEAELPDAQFQVVLPAWLKPFIVREVTGDPLYTNSSIAERLARSGTWTQ